MDSGGRSRMFGHRLALFFLLAGVFAIPASAARLLGLRTAPHGDSLRVVLDISAKSPVELTSASGGKEWRLRVSGVVEAEDSLKDIPAPHSSFESISPRIEGGDLVVVIRAWNEARANPFWIPPKGGKPWRYVIDLAAPGKGKATRAPDAAAAGPAARGTPVTPEPVPRRGGKWRILIDPGHGGADPGARRGKLIEKEIVLDVARRLEAILNKSDACEARLSRRDDRRLGLRERHELADAYGADAFLSIHVNAAPAKKALGVEVFFLSLRGASDEASRELAKLENEADPEYVFEEDSLLQGIPFSFDLRQSDTILRSSRLAESILVSLEASHLAASRGVKQAGFGVLKSFQVPSILVEVGFLSNPQEGKRLAKPSHRQDLAEGIAQGAIAYFKAYAPTRLGSNDSR